MAIWNRAWRAPPAEAEIAASAQLLAPQSAFNSHSESWANGRSSVRRGTALRQEMMEPDQAPAAGVCGARPPRRMSLVFEELSRDASEAVTILQVREALGDRSLAALLAFFAAINLLPLPPGTTVVLGPPLVIVAVQMMLGQAR